MKENLLIIFAKNPKTEKVKTRLATTVGEKKAKEIYEDVLNKLIKYQKNNEYDTKLYIQGKKDYFKKAELEIIHQKGNNLGDKMLNAFKDELLKYQKVIIIGSDLILNNKFITNAFNFKEDCVIGPAEDGGYYLIGLNEPQDIFKNIEWGKSTVFKETIKLLKIKYLKVKKLEFKRDIDDYKDYLYYKEKGILK
jgi:rSAM/selenodomain-associated transferase 1